VLAAAFDAAAHGSRWSPVQAALEGVAGQLAGTTSSARHVRDELFNETVADQMTERSRVDVWIANAGCRARIQDITKALPRRLGARSSTPT